MKPKAAVIVDNLLLAKWQKDALDEVTKKIDIELILNCKNTKIKRKIIKHSFYYIINFFSLKNFLTKKNKINFENISKINFYSLKEGNWQLLPKEVINQLNSKNIKIIIKFGMNLLKIDKNISEISILSYHHGNPSKYRGRPAGFYEILNNEKSIGIVVQSLTNKLDSGKILALANSKIENFSYTKTAINFYGNSKYLLSKAIDNLLQNKEINLEKNGKINKLPSNLVVLKFFVSIFKNLIRKIFYGLFFEKKWKVAITGNNLSFDRDETIISENALIIPINKKYNFYADPFFSSDNKFIRLEALNKLTGLGELLNISTTDLKNQKLIFSKGHNSYPFSFVFKKKEYLLPEVASHSSQYFLSVDENFKKKYFIKGLEDKRIVDATLFEFQKYWYLFFGENQNSSTVLNLWTSNTPFEKFYPHPKTPIVISPKNARMAGALFISNNRLLRFSQNNEKEYGESLSVLEINQLSQKVYSEKYIGRIKIDKFKGPHTINFNKETNQIIYDYYYDKFSFFAGTRRIVGWFNK